MENLQLWEDFKNESLEAINEAKSKFEKDFEALDLKPLEKELKKVLGINIKLDKRNVIRDNYFNIESTKNLASDSGIFSAAFSEVYIKTFNAAYSEKDKSYWMTFNLSYQHKEGGSNGVKVLTAWHYPKTNKWEFETPQL